MKLQYELYMPAPLRRKFSFFAVILSVVYLINDIIISPFSTKLQKKCQTWEIQTLQNTRNSSTCITNSLGNSLFLSLWLYRFLISFSILLLYSNLSKYKYVYMCVMENKNIKIKKSEGYFWHALHSDVLGSVMSVCFLRTFYWSLKKYSFNTLLSMKIILYY